ncbi:MAG: hypothetical protein IJP98_06415 [Clostridia bacterium]|nr:hypothetical protein [Clostridia bacterium]
MERRSMRRLMALLLCVFILVGCVRGDPVVSVVPNTAAPVETPSERPAEVRTTAPAATPYIELATPTPEPFDLSPYRVSDGGMYDILPLIADGDKKLLHAGFAGEGRLLLLFYDETGSELSWQRFDLQTAERTVLRTEPTDDPEPVSYQFLFYSSDPPLYYDAHTDAVICMTADLQGAWTIPSERITAARYWWDGDSVLLYDSNSHTIRRISPDGTETELFSTGWRFRYASIVSVSDDRRYAALDAYDAYLDAYVTLLIDLLTGEIVGQRAGETHLSVSNTRFSGISREYEWDSEAYIGTTTLTIACADTPTDPSTRQVRIQHQDFYPTLYDVPGGFVAEVWDEACTLYYWDDAGEREWCAEIPTAPYQPTVDAYWAAWEPQENGFEDGGDAAALYPYVNADGADSRYLLCEMRFDDALIGMLLWDRTAGTVTRTVSLTYDEPLFGPVPAFDATPERYAARVDAIRERYGVTVLLGEAAQLTISSYTADVFPIEESPLEIDSALDVLEEVFAVYPPDFFRLLCEGSTDSIIFELCGRISATSGDAIDSPGAVTCHADGARIVVLDIRYAAGLRYTLFHEISHLIDHHLDAIVVAEPDGWNNPYWSYSGWNRLNPDGFSYHGSYLNEDGNSYEYNGSTKYTPLHKDYEKKHKRNSVYFADLYSKTFATEDRAVLMGMLLDDNASDELLSCPHLLAKLEYYSEAIRGLMDPDGTHWPEPTVWETRIAELKARD